LQIRAHQVASRSPFLIPLGSVLLAVLGFEFQQVVVVLLVVIPVIRADSPDVFLSVRAPPFFEFFAVSALILSLLFLAAFTARTQFCLSRRLVFWFGRPVFQTLTALLLADLIRVRPLPGSHVIVCACFAEAAVSIAVTLAAIEITERFLLTTIGTSLHAGCFTKINFRFEDGERSVSPSCNVGTAPR
jgi:hypothetical protein